MSRSRPPTWLRAICSTLRLATVAAAAWTALSFPLRAQTAPLVSLPRFTHPGEGQIIYFLLTDRFENGSTANDSGGYAGGSGVSGFDPTSGYYYHGGDFIGLTSRLGYLKDLGVTAIWVTPPFTNRPVQGGSAGYHGYWITDFLSIDPHLGTDADFRAFVAQAHALGMRVYLDIVVNHTADVIQYVGGTYTYRSLAQYPYRDSNGVVFDASADAYNGIGPATFPTLSVNISFPYVPTVSAADANVKNPSWLNDLTVYHNRGNSTFTGEDSVFGDFSGLDDLFTEQPKVVNGMIDIYEHWMRDYGIDGYRIDTMKHVNQEFWEAFLPAIREQAHELGRDDFIAFGEVTQGDPAFVSSFSTTATADAELDFPMEYALRDYVSQWHGTTKILETLDEDDYYTRHDGNVYDLPTFLGNHDMGRWGYFLKQDNPSASDAQLEQLMELGYGVLYLMRGQPVVYYGDEQGLYGTGGDWQAREDMFPTQVSTFKTLKEIGSTLTGADSKFVETTPLYVFLKELGTLRSSTPAFERGAMLVRASGNGEVLAFSRIERGEKVEYLAAFNADRSQTASVALQTCQPAGSTLVRVFDSTTPEDPGSAALTADAGGKVTLTLAPLQFTVWKAAQPLGTPPVAPTVAIGMPAAGTVMSFPATTTDGQTFPVRQEIEANVAGGDGYAEVTFALERSSRPGQYEILGTDDAPPYRVYWAPPNDLGSGETFRIIATVDDLRGDRASATVENLSVAAGSPSWGIRGAVGPSFGELPAATLSIPSDSSSALGALVLGTSPMRYQWYHDGEAVAGATGPVLHLRGSDPATAGAYRLVASNLAGTTICRDSVVTIGAPLHVPGQQPASKLVAISVRSYVGTNDQIQVAGFVVTGSGPKQLLVRSSGPALAPYGVSNPLPDPELVLYDSKSQPISTTVGWDSSLASVFAKEGAFGWPVGSLDSATVLTLNPGLYTVEIKSKTGQTGVALAEVYDVSGATSYPLSLSARAFVGADSNVLIAGISVQGTAPKRVLIRAAGPALAAYGVTGYLPDPVLELYNNTTSTPTLMQTNDDWDVSLAGDFAQASAFDWTPGSTDAAMVVTLQPGLYTAIVRGKPGQTGVALVEVYDMD